LEQLNDHGTLDSVAPADPVKAERLQMLLEALSLTGSEARTLLALLRFGSATMSQLSQATGIGRSNLYPVLESLQARSVAQRLSGRYAVWHSPGPAEVLAILEVAEAAEAARAAAAREAFQRAEEARAATARELFQQRLAEARTELTQLSGTSNETAEVIVIGDDARLAVLYQEAMATVEGEILVFNRGPYPGEVEPSPQVMESVARGVRARALYQSAELDDAALRHCADVYARAGVEQRVVDALPVSMAVLGDQLVLLCLPRDEDPFGLDTHSAMVCNRGMVQLVVTAFERLWNGVDLSWADIEAACQETAAAREAASA